MGKGGDGEGGKSAVMTSRIVTNENRRREWESESSRIVANGSRIVANGIVEIVEIVANGFGGVVNGFVGVANGSSASRMGLAASQMGSSGGVTNGFVRRRRQCVRRWCIWEAYQLMVYGTAKIKKRRDKMMSKGSIYIQVFSDENAPSPMPFKFVANVSHF